MAFKDSIVPLTLARFDASGLLDATYQAINPDGLDGPCFYLRINNRSDTAVVISFAPDDDHFVLSAGQIFELGSQTNAQPNNYRALFKKGSVIYVRGTAGTGTINVAGFYQN